MGRVRILFLVLIGVAGGAVGNVVERDTSAGGFARHAVLSFLAGLAGRRIKFSLEVGGVDDGKR